MVWKYFQINVRNITYQNLEDADKIVFKGNF